MPDCFVVMGYGVKTDFQQNKSFDLDKTYRNIIKPAAEAAGYTCVRADDIQHAGVIDLPMYEQLLTADLVVADLSTANVNAFFELGVRYALRPKTTIAIAEKGFKIPFDMGHVVIRHYEHLGPGIDYDEVQRMRKDLTDACRQIPASGRIDSPVYTFITNLVAPSRQAVAEAMAAAAVQASDERTREALAKATTQEEKDALEKPLASLVSAAMAARGREDFATMRDVLLGVRAAQGNNPDPFVVQQLALATYKAKDREAKSALREAKAVLDPLKPEESSDPETLGLWGAIHKRLWSLNEIPYEERLAALTTAIWAHEKGFYLKNDYYNGINLAFLLNVRAKELAGDEAIADRVQARRIRERVLAICRQLLADGVKGESGKGKRDEEYWVRATIAEALLGSGRPTEAEQAFNEAKNIKPEPWMLSTTEKQLANLRRLVSAG
jgi:tetratricopeptide repeat protein